MIFPKGQAVYENLNTSFTNFGELLLDLKANGFTGYIQISFWDYEGVLFLDAGNIVNAIEKAGEIKSTGQEAVNAITAKVKEKDGTISVYHLSAEMVTMLTSVVKSQVIYADLTTDFTSLDKLIAKLQKEGHTGYIEVTMRDEKGVGIIFLQAGESIESILSTNGDAIVGADVLPRIVETASTLGAAFNVYRAAITESFAEGAEIMSGFDLPELLTVWGEIIAAVERVADSQFKSEHFMNTFKDTLIEKADDYPFLDPFAAEFEYQNGQIAFHGESVKDFGQGLGDCLSATIGKLVVEARGDDLATKIRAELRAVKEKYAAAVKKFDLETALPEFLGQ